MKKRAVVYDKWLKSLGGGEIVACNIAKILSDVGYEVTFVAGNRIDKETIKNKLDVDLSKVSLVEVWSDEAKIKQISKGKDLFINASFIDYTYGCAKKNIYYTHFPKEPYNTLGEMLFTKFLLPFITRFINPIEMISDLEITTVRNNEPAYLLKRNNKIAIPYLKKNKPHTVEFSFLLGCFTQSLMKAININFEEAKILDKDFFIDHHHNQINFRITIKPMSDTAYLEIEITKLKGLEKEDQVFLLYPKTKVIGAYEGVFEAFYHRINNKLRSGIFSNPLERLKSYQIILANSSFTQKWIKNYWQRDSRVLYPPVEMISNKHHLEKNIKKKWICTVGRFFILGHGKKQDILIEAFKKLCNDGLKDWQLHLVGGVSNDKETLKYVESLKKEAEGYPIYFHFDISREEVERIYLSSKIYWHAAGYGIDQNKEPIKMEHFGITTVEAMSAGCVPVVIRAGGQPEIVTDDCGYLWNSKEELASCTSKLIYNPKLLELKRKNALKRSLVFSLDNFKKQFLKYI